MRLSVPLSFWLAGFFAIYALQGLACSRHWPDTLAARPMLIAAGVSIVVVQAVLFVAVARASGPSRFVRIVAIALGATAVAAAVWTILPVAVASVCL